MNRLLIWVLAAGLSAAVPALAANHPRGGGGHPAAHSAARMHTSRPAAHFSRHRPSAHRAVHRTVHHAVRHSSRRVVRRAVHHAVHHAARHASHAAVAHKNGRYAKVRRSVRAMRQFHAGAYRRPADWYAHHWAIGERLPRGWFARDYWLGDWAIYGLWAPVDGLIWVRVGPDAMLVDPASGAVVGVEYSLFF
jgi:Ni/Co efflux regulator RcnB